MSAPLVQAKNVSQSFLGVDVFSGISLAIDQGTRLGLIGANGSGKSTLIDILTGHLSPDQGEVTTRKNLRQVLVAQEPAFDPAHTPQEAVTTFLKAMSTDQPEQAARVWLSRAQFTPTSPVGQLSGGMKKRLQIIQAAACAADLVYLDEPTNHLDQEGVAWLTTWLIQQVKTFVLVTHNRAFLEDTATAIFELNRQYPEGAFFVDGRYSSYLEKKAQWQVAQTQQLSALENKSRREEHWLAQGVKARTTKAKGRIDKTLALRQELAETKDRLRQQDVALQFQDSHRQTKKLIELKEISFAHEENELISSLSYILRPNRIIGIVGANGVGKTTLLRLIAGQLTPSKGSVVSAPDLKTFVYDQHRQQLNPEWTLKRALSETGDSVVYRGNATHVASWAKRFRFGAERLTTFVSDLSGGERARVALARMMLQPADVLFLDEPTNDLDIPTLELLEQSLAEFTGAVVLITHDRFMMEKICDEFIGFTPQGIQTFATWQQWHQACREKKKAVDKTKREAKATQKNRTKRLSYMEQREYDQMEEQILEAEELVASLKEQVDAQATSAHALAETCDALSAAEDKVKAMYERWAELEEKQK